MGQKLLQLSGKLGPLFALILVIMIFSIATPKTFLTFLNFKNLISQTAVIATAAVGMTFIIVSAGIDLSAGSLVALSGVLTTMSIAATGSLGVGLLVGLCSGLLCGAINGITITKGKLPPFIVTLGMLEILRGTALQSTGGLPISKNLSETFNNISNAVFEIPIGSVKDPFINTTGVIIGNIANGLLAVAIVTFLIVSIISIKNRMNSLPISTLMKWTLVISGFTAALFALIDIIKLLNYYHSRDNILLIPYSVFILIPVAVIGGFILKYTVFGVQVYAVGSNEQTARLCGVNVDRVKLYVYMIGGLTVALAGILQASRLQSGQPSTGLGLELDIIAAVVVGGGSLMGGEGTILGSVVGAFIIRILRNGCVLMDISPFVQRIIIGLIIIAAVFVDQLRRRSMESSKTG